MEQKIKESICKLVCDGMDMGTGFLISNEYIMTAAHVIPTDCSKIEAVFLEKEDSPLFYKCSELMVQPDIDIALLNIDTDKKISINPLEISTKKLVNHSKFLTAGYPSEASPLSAVIYGEIIDTYDGVNPCDFNIDLEVEQGVLENYSGLSGAPLIIGGVVFGVVTYQNAKKLKAIELNRIISYLDKLLPCKNLNKCISNIEAKQFDYMKDLIIDDYLLKMKYINVLVAETRRVLFLLKELLEVERQLLYKI